MTESEEKCDLITEVEEDEETEDEDPFVENPLLNEFEEDSDIIAELIAL